MEAEAQTAWSGVSDSVSTACTGMAQSVTSQIDSIKASALPRRLIRKFKCNDPFELAEALDIDVMERADFKRQKGAFKVILFRPFAALRGFDDEISSEGASKLLVKKVELSDEEKNDLSDKLLQVKKGMKVVVRYFVRTTECTGKYISLTGTVVMIDPVYRELKVMQDSDRKAVGIEKELPVIIPFDDIANLAGEGITSIADYLGIEKYPDDI